MTGESNGIKLEAAAVTDRGLSEKRPLNEDSFLSDVGRGIFAVADGVGGAEAGEVASQTAVEVLGEAFRHQRNGDDVEDLMEIAIQRANASIHRMARESQHLAMMATTIVALHLDGRRATIGHVGDSRLYRLDSDGSVHRETEDHSVVEEEVRAGRMTPEQARNHPSRNVISRALGAEASVEVDLKTMEVEAGTTFLLCSDGITRHITDDELGAVVRQAASLDAACAELKRRCFERGAEDNLTAVLVRVGDADETLYDTFSGDEEQTIITQRAQAAGAAPAASLPGTPAPVAPAQNSGAALAAPAPGAAGGDLFRRPFDDAGRDVTLSAAEQAGTDGRAESTDAPGQAAQPPPPRPARHLGGAVRLLAALFFVVLAAAGGFYAGLRYQQERAAAVPRAVVEPSPEPVPSPAGNDFEARKTTVDRAPLPESVRMSALLSERPENGEDPEFLYLYGRSLMRSGAEREAAAQFEQATRKIQERFTSDKASLLIDSYTATIAAHVGANELEKARAASEDFKMMVGNVAPGGEAGAAPASSPAPQ